MPSDTEMIALIFKEGARKLEEAAASDLQKLNEWEWQLIQHRLELVRSGDLVGWEAAKEFASWALNAYRWRVLKYAVAAAHEAEEASRGHIVRLLGFMQKN